MQTLEKEKNAQIPADREELMSLMRQVYQQELKAAGKKTLSLEQIKEKFLALPGEEYREYEVTVAGFARDWADFIIKKRNPDEEPLLTQLLPEQGQTLVYGSDEEKIAFAAFAVAINYERLQKNPEEEEELLNKYREFFGKKTGNTAAAEKYEHPYFFHLEVLDKMDMAVGSKDEFLEELLTMAKINSLNLSKNHGGHHAYAETVALVFENASAQLREKLENAPEHWLEDAKTSAIKAIAQDDRYAKYYCTYGRLLALCGEYEEAIKNVNLAISYEKNTRTDYSIRIGQYSSYYQQFRAQQKLKVQEEAMAEQMKEMKLAMEAQEKESLAKNMEFLGLFSGIVSFTIGSLTLASNFTSEDAMKIAGLIVILMGALMCVFSAFGVILHGVFGTIKDRKTGEPKHGFIGRHLTVFVAGLLVVVGGILLCIFF